MRIVDANVILRYVLSDHAELSEQARQMIDESAVMVPIEVLCEVVYVLASVYHISRLDISTELTGFFTRTRCELPHRNAVLKGIEVYGSINEDFVDCILVGYAEIEGAVVHTFDKSLQKRLKTLDML